MGLQVLQTQNNLLIMYLLGQETKKIIFLVKICSFSICWNLLFPYFTCNLQQSTLQKINCKITCMPNR